MNIKIGDCVIIPDGRIGRIREKIGNVYKVRVMRKTSNTHQFLFIDKNNLELIDCPKGWMSRDGYNNYVKKTLIKMKKRLIKKNQK